MPYENNLIGIPGLVIEVITDRFHTKFLQSLYPANANTVNLETISKKRHVGNSSPYCWIQYGFSPLVELLLKIIVGRVCAILKNRFANCWMSSAKIM
jgi:hypothetical protein